MQLLKDNVAGIDGLDNARLARLSPGGKHALVTSADDDSLAVFGVDSQFRLRFLQVFKNDHNTRGLEGANAFVFSADGQRVYVQSYYDSAVVDFKYNPEGGYQLKQVISDEVSVTRIFKDETPLGALDKLGLFGAYDIAITADNRQLFVASVMSSALSVFDINADGSRLRGGECDCCFCQKLTRALSVYPIDW
ncbi:MAG: 6-phosphogluconolactonase (cycloisomerase 2 family) [Alteromonadaceae bacterium]|jgi:6-phosphogluconolactonase (cycloisomerase 2 family)